MTEPEDYIDFLRFRLEELEEVQGEIDAVVEATLRVSFKVASLRDLLGTEPTK